MKKLGFLSLPFLLLASPAVPDEAELIGFLDSELAEVRGYIDARDAAPLEAGFFKSDKGDYQDRIDGLLDEALAIVAPESHGFWSDQLENIEQAREDAENRRGKLILERMQARTSKGVGLIGAALGREHESGSVEDITAKLDEIEIGLAQLEEDRKSVLLGFAQSLEDLHGIDLDPQLAKALLYSINGSLMVEQLAVLKSLAEVERRLGAVLQADVGTDVRRNYTGVAALTRLMHVRLLQRHLEAYEGAWLPSLAEKTLEARNLLEETRRQAMDAQLENVRASYRNNIEIQKRTIDVMGKYQSMLERRATMTKEALAMAQERAGAAVNTLRTLESARGLSRLISDSTERFNAITNFELPELQDLDPEEFEEMLDISRSLGS